MISKLQFDIAWLTAERGTDAERATYGELSVRAEERSLTDVVDTIAQTTRDSNEMGAAGGGFVWPRLSFATDGWAVQLRAKLRPATSARRIALALKFLPFARACPRAGGFGVSTPHARRMAIDGSNDVCRTGTRHVAGFSARLFQ
jgi:hypothetical protein